MIDHPVLGACIALSLPSWANIAEIVGLEADIAANDTGACQVYDDGIGGRDITQ